MHIRTFRVLKKDKVLARGLDVTSLCALILGYSASSVEKISFTIVEEERKGKEEV